MFKLLYYLDFLNFKEVGKSVTDLEYYAWNFGPVPKKFYFELLNDNPPQQLLKTYIKERDELTGKVKGIRFSCTKSPNTSVFSKREIKILEWVSEVFKDATGEDMSNATHLKNAPWDVTRRTKGDKAYIDFMLAIDDESLVDRDFALEQMRASKELESFFGFKS